MLAQLPPSRGMALLITLIMVLLLSLEVAMISLVALRGLGDEGALLTRNTAARRGAEVALNRLNTKLTLFLNQSGTPAQVDTSFAMGQGQAINAQTLTLDNPDSGTSNSPVTITAYVKERRGNLYHMIGRATDGSVDLVLHRWIQIQPCPDALQIIVSDRSMTNPVRPWYWDELYPYILSDSTGRVFFGEDSASGRFWSWSESTGLSTIVTGENQPGFNAMAVASDGRVFFGEPNSGGSFWTWKDGVLTTIISSIGNGVYKNRIYVGTDGRVVFGEKNTGFAMNKGTIWTWKDGILSTIFAPSASKMGITPFGIGSDGRIYYQADYAGTYNQFLYYWKDGSPPTTGQVFNDYADSIRFGQDGRIYFQYLSAPSKIYTWKFGDPVVDKATPLFSASTDLFLLGVDSSSQLYYSRWYNSGTDSCHIGTSGGVLQTIALGNGYDLLCGEGGIAFPSDGKVYMSGMVWDPTLLTTIRYMPSDNFDEFAVASDGRVFGSEISNGKLWSWKSGVLSTIVTGQSGAGEQAVGVASDGRVFWGQDNATGKLWTWKAGVGLSTLATGNKIGVLGIRVAPNGRVFFGEVGAAGKVWTWKEQNCSL